MKARPSASLPSPVRRLFRNARMALSYVAWGDEAAPLAILIHGSRDHGRSWDAIAHALSETHHVIAPDLRGHGDSDWAQDGRYEFAAYLSDLTALCDTLGVSAERPIALIGHSLGAHIALRYAGTFPDHVRQLVTIEAVGAPLPVEAHRAELSIASQLHIWFEERRTAERVQPREFASLQDAVDRMRTRHAYLTEQQASHLTHHGLRRNGDTWQWKYDPYLAVFPFPDITPEEREYLWQQIASPTLLIYGERSWPSDIPPQVLRAITDATEVRLSESGHWPQHDAPDACLSAITDFLMPSAT